MQIEFDLRKMNNDNTEKFDGYAGDYTVGRPNYAAGLIDLMYDAYGMSCSSSIADIGSGTGKFAVHMLSKGSTVYCVEPNDDMRLTAEKELRNYPNFHSVKGDAEHFGLRPDSVDFITTAQAFHWFDAGRFRKECERVIKDNGKVFLIWNVRDMSSEINQELFKVYERYCPDFVGFSGGIKKDDRRIRAFFDDQYDYVSFDNPLSLDKDKFIARSLSGSYSIKEADRNYDEYMKKIDDIFERYSRKGKVMIANRSVAYIGTV